MIMKVERKRSGPCDSFNRCICPSLTTFKKTVNYFRSYKGSVCSIVPPLNPTLPYIALVTFKFKHFCRFKKSKTVLEIRGMQSQMIMGCIYNSDKRKKNVG